jgi:P27 family predicted phage terminase small subunit
VARHRKPLAQLKAEGAYRADRHGFRREVPAEGDLSTRAAPAHLTELERQVWKQTLNVAPRALLKTADTVLLASFCSAVARHRRALAEYWVVPLVSDDGVLTPLARELTRLELLISRLGSELGLSPIARTRINAPEPPKGLEEIETPEFLRRFGRLEVVSDDKALTEG